VGSEMCIRDSFYNMIPGNPLGESVRIGIYVPMDDYNHLHWEISTPRARLERL